VKRMLVLGYIQVIFPRTVRSHLAKAELLHATNMNGKNCVISIREWNHIHVQSKVFIIDGTCIKINIQLVSIGD
jgi:hypothetical protein